MLRIDGSQGEGGGQLLRSSLAFSALTGLPFVAEKIRANRQKPGLRPQHLAAVRLVAQMCGARCLGDEVNSGLLEFRPGPLRSGHFQQDIGTAGSLILLLQAALLPALKAGGPVTLELRGGTDVPMAPPLDYVTEVVLPYYRRLGSIEVEVSRRGFNPRGEGLVKFRIEGHEEPVPPLLLTGPTTWGEVQGHALATLELEPARVSERMAASARACLRVGRAVSSYLPSASPGAALTLWCSSQDGERWVGASALGRKGLAAEEVGRQAALRLAESLAHPRPADEYLADQLVPLLALAGGEMECQMISDHCATNIEICQLFSGTRFSIEDTVVRAQPS